MRYLISVSPLALFLGALATSLLAITSNAVAEKADKTKPLNVESDRAVRDDIAQITTFTGRVVMTKGTLLLKGDKLVLREDPEGYQYGVMTGQQASFRQKRDLPDQFFEGFGREINYDGKSEIVKFIDKAYVRRLTKEVPTDEIRGKVVIYDARTENYTVEGNSGSAPDTSNPSDRVRVTIQPKIAPEDKPTGEKSGQAPKPRSSVNLKPAGALSLPAASN